MRCFDLVDLVSVGRVVTSNKLLPQRPHRVAPPSSVIYKTRRARIKKVETDAVLIEPWTFLRTVVEAFDLTFGVTLWG